jgi:hypothetical protein
MMFGLVNFRNSVPGERQAARDVSLAQCAPAAFPLKRQMLADGLDRHFLVYLPQDTSRRGAASHRWPPIRHGAACAPTPSLIASSDRSGLTDHRWT